jgi:hypothetical protein
MASDNSVCNLPEDPYRDDPTEGLPICYKHFVLGHCIRCVVDEVQRAAGWERSEPPAVYPTADGGVMPLHEPEPERE